MSKFSSLTENRYTLNDIFTKKYEMWAMLPLLIYLIAPIIHMLIFTKNFSLVIYDEWIPVFLSSGTFVGDYFKEIVHYAFLIGSIFAIVAVLSFISYNKENRISSTSNNIPTFLFLGYLALIVVSSIVNKTEFNYIMGFTARAEGVLSFFAYYLIYYLCGSLISNEKLKYYISYIFLLTGLIIGILTVINQYWFEIYILRQFTFGTRLLPAGIFYTHNFYAYYLAISIMLSAGLTILDKSKKRRILAFVIFALDTFILAVNDTMGAFLACIVAFAFFIFILSIRDRKFAYKILIMFAVFIAIIFVVGLFTQSFLSELTGLVKDVETIATDSENAGDAGTARWGLWYETFKYIKQKPWTGWGFEGTAEMLQDATGQDKAHNEYLENMAYFGIPAGLIYIAALGSVYIKAIKNRKKLDNITICCLVAALGYIGSALVGNSFIFTAPYCFIFLGLGSTTLHGEKKWAECSCCKAKPESCNRQPD